jgi:hypothetical protein
MKKGTKTAKECDITQLSLLFITVVSTAVALCIVTMKQNRDIDNFMFYKNNDHGVKIQKRNPNTMGNYDMKKEII